MGTNIKNNKINTDGDVHSNKKYLYCIIFLIAGIAINCIGKKVAVMFNLPIWLDSIGTGLTACVLGPVYGAICGAALNIIYGIFSTTSYVYGIVSIAIGVIIGISYRKINVYRIFNAMTVSVIIAFTSAILSTPINLMFWQGRTTNIWGDALFDMLSINGINKIVASFLGELLVDFPDKIIVILIMYCIINIPWVKKRFNNSENGKKELSDSVVEKTIQSVVFAVLLGSMIAGNAIVSAQIVRADEKVSESKTNADVNAEVYTQTLYNSEDGLTAGEANSIVETKDGYIWIGTYAGLYRYDGRKFDLMNFDSVKNVNRLYVDDEGCLWIGTNDNGISIYKDGKIIKVIDKTNGLPSNSIRCIGQAQNGDFYIGTSSSLCIISENDYSISKIFTEVIYANSVAVREDGLVTVITNAGSIYFIKNREIQSNHRSDMEGVAFTSCTYTKKGKLYLGTSSDIVCIWDDESKTVKKDKLITTSSFSYIHAMYEDEEGRIWICTDKGIGYIYNDVFHIIETGVFNSSIDNMLKDYQGNMWFTSSRLGVLKLSLNSFCDIYSQCGAESKVVNSVTKWNGYLYSGTDNGLEAFDLDTKEKIKNELTEKMGASRIRCLRVDSENSLWISTSSGLVQVTQDGNISSFNSSKGTVGERFRSTIEMSDGMIVAAENTGIDFIKNGEVIAALGSKDGLTNPQILSMIEMDDNTLYAGSDGDGIMVIRDMKVVDKIDEKNGLPSGVILRMVKVRDGLLIVTSNSLCYRDHDGNIKVLKNFPYSNNYDVIASNDEKLWVLGSAGIYIIEEKDLFTEEQIKYELLDNRKGLNTSLTANSWNYVDGSKLYFAGNTGAYSVDMNNYMLYTGEYLTKIECIDSDNVTQMISESGSINISKNINRITIRPEILNYTLNDPYISYYLEGVDSKEYVVQQSSLEDISYTNIPAGNYTFHIAILDNTGNKEIQSHVYHICKLPQFYEYIWFKAYLAVICVLGIAYVTWLFTVVRSNKIIEKQKQEIVIAKRQAEMGNETIIAIAKAVDAKDENTSQHSERVAKYSVMIAKKLGWGQKECDNLRQIALLHDIGKIGIPDSILNKPARLTDEEYTVMKSHVEIGAKILKDFTLVDNVADGVRYHHERYDGMGYGEHLKGKDIPLDARIICIADAFDAMTANRVYRKHLEMDYVINELIRCKGSQFDPELIDILLELIKDGSINEILNEKKEN